MASVQSLSRVNEASPLVGKVWKRTPVAICGARVSTVAVLVSVPVAARLSVAVASTETAFP